MQAPSKEARSREVRRSPRRSRSGRPSRRERRASRGSRFLQRERDLHREWEARPVRPTLRATARSQAPDRSGRRDRQHRRRGQSGPLDRGRGCSSRTEILVRSAKEKRRKKSPRFGAHASKPSRQTQTRLSSRRREACFSLPLPGLEHRAAAPATTAAEASVERHEARSEEHAHRADFDTVAGQSEGDSA